MIKRFFTVFTLVIAVALVAAPHAEAKRFGGGKSFGKSFKTAPAKRQQTDTISRQQTQKPAAAANQSSGRKGLLGGILGGVLAGGLLAAMFGGAFDGLQFMDILIFAVIAFVIFKIFKHLKSAKATSMGHKEAYAGNSPQSGNAQRTTQNSNMNQQSTQPRYESTDSDVPFNLPPNFKMDAFLKGSRDHYRTIQQAWNVNDLTKIREYVSADLFRDLSAERATLTDEQKTEVMYVDADLVRADYTASLAQLSIQFSGRYKDSAEGVEEPITDIWHLERDLTCPNSPWLIVGIEG